MNHSEAGSLARCRSFRVQAQRIIRSSLAGHHWAGGRLAQTGQAAYLGREKHSILSPHCCFSDRNPAFSSLDSVLLQPVLSFLSQGHKQKNLAPGLHEASSSLPILRFQHPFPLLLLETTQVPSSTRTHLCCDLEAPVYMNGTAELASQTVI